VFLKRKDGLQGTKRKREIRSRNKLTMADG
jgi:hypothetical protein